jgi:hypothetical protein
MPYLNDLLSQYECLLAICRFVSSADIAHLAATCKENHASITAGELTYNRLKKDAICDGKGIVAHGPQSAGVGLLGSRCEALHRVWCASLQRMCCYPEADTHSTSKCSTNTCALQHCRFHFAYCPDGYDRAWSDIDPDEMDSETGEYPIHRDWEDIESCTKTAAKRRRLSYAKPRQSSRNRAGRLRVKAAKGHSPQPLRGKKSAGVADVICGLTSWVSAGCAFHASSLRRPRHTKMFNGRLERMGKWYANSHAACLRND